MSGGELEKNTLRTILSTTRLLQRYEQMDPVSLEFGQNNGFLTRQGAGGVGDHVLLGGRVRVFG